MVAYVVEQLDDVVVDPGPLAGMDLMSPFVWREGNGYRMLLRGVPKPKGPDQPTGVIAAASCEDGLHFTVEPLERGYVTDDRAAVLRKHRRGREEGSGDGGEQVTHESSLAGAAPGATALD